MTYNSRDKLNAIYAAGTVGVAALLGAIAQSWVLFVLIAAGLISVFVSTGQIRLPNERTRTKRK